MGRTTMLRDAAEAARRGRLADLIAQAERTRRAIERDHREAERIYSQGIMPRPDWQRLLLERTVAVVGVALGVWLYAHGFFGWAWQLVTGG